MTIFRISWYNPQGLSIFDSVECHRKKNTYKRHALKAIIFMHNISNFQYAYIRPNWCSWSENAVNISSFVNIMITFLVNIK